MCGGANPQLAMISNKIDSMLFQLDRVRSVIWNALHHLDDRDLNFEPARRAWIGVNFSGDDHARFLRQATKRFERDRLILERDDALDRPSTVAKNREK